jgi:acetyl-CoA carboxylase carboxyltransferase component
LRGSAKSAGAFARAAADIPTLAMLLAEGGIATGIGLYNLRLSRTLRGQRGNGNGKDSFIILTGYEAINKMFNADLFPNQSALGGSKRMLAEGMSTHLVSSEAEGMLAALKVLDQNPAIPDIRHIVTLPGLPTSAARISVSKMRGQRHDLGIAIRASQQKIARIAEEKKLPYPPDVYDTRDELAAFVDPGSFVSVPTKTHHAVLGFGTKDGYPVALWGIQMLPEFDLDENGRLKIIKGVPQVKPGMTLPADAAAEIASFLESLPPWMAILSDPAASGYDPRTVAASGEHGARLASAQTLHPAPQTSWVGPNKRVLGGMYVTIGEDLSPDKIKLFADPTSTVAVLDPKGWKGIGFYKNHVSNVARLLQQRDGLEKEEAQKIATAMVDQVITIMSTIRRAETAGAISEIVGANEIGAVMSKKVRGWYEGEEFRRLYASTLKSPS